MQTIPLVSPFVYPIMLLLAYKQHETATAPSQTSKHAKSAYQHALPRLQHPHASCILCGGPADQHSHVMSTCALALRLHMEKAAYSKSHMYRIFTQCLAKRPKCLLFTFSVIRCTGAAPPCNLRRGNHSIQYQQAGYYKNRPMLCRVRHKYRFGRYWSHSSQYHPDNLHQARCSRCLRMSCSHSSQLRYHKSHQHHCSKRQ